LRTRVCRARTGDGCDAEIYGWFTEGFDTADLKDAKALLEELNRRKALDIQSSLPYSRSSICRHLRVPWLI
jgi:hypothetical protein